MVHALLRHDAEINAPCAAGNTPLMLAAAHGDEAIVHALLQRNASADAVRADGMTALKLAVLHGRERVVGALLQHQPRLALHESHAPVCPRYWSKSSMVG